MVKIFCLPVKVSLKFQSFSFQLNFGRLLPSKCQRAVKHSAKTWLQCICWFLILHFMTPVAIAKSFPLLPRLQHHNWPPHTFPCRCQSPECVAQFCGGLISMWFILQPHLQAHLFPCPPSPLWDIGNLHCQKQNEPIVIYSSKLSTVGACVLENTMDIRNHLTPESNDQYYYVTIYISEAGQLKVNAVFRLSRGVDLLQCTLYRLKWRWDSVISILEGCAL